MGRPRIYASDVERVRAWRKRNPGHGLTADDVLELIAAQGGGCAICGRKPRTKERALAIDHDHATGRVRGLLCYRCNTAIGLLGDDPDRLIRAADYLT